MTTRNALLSALDELREVNFAAYCQVSAGNWIMAHAIDDATADWWKSDDAARILADIKECVANAKDGVR